jgi:hypothetical protein
MTLACFFVVGLGSTAKKNILRYIPHPKKKHYQMIIASTRAHGHYRCILRIPPLPACTSNKLLAAKTRKN